MIRHQPPLVASLSQTGHAEENSSKQPSLMRYGSSPNTQKRHDRELTVTVEDTLAERIDLPWAMTPTDHAEKINYYQASRPRYGSRPRTQGQGDPEL